MNKIKFLLMLGVLLSTHLLNAAHFERFIFEVPYACDQDYLPENILSYGQNTVVFEQDGYTISVLNKQIVHLAKKGKEDAPFFMKHLKRNIDLVELVCDNKGNPVFIAAHTGKSTLSFIKRSRLKELHNFLYR